MLWYDASNVNGAAKCSECYWSSYSSTILCRFLSKWCNFLRLQWTLTCHVNQFILESKYMFCVKDSLKAFLWYYLQYVTGLSWKKKLAWKSPSVSSDCMKDFWTYRIKNCWNILCTCLTCIPVKWCSRTARSAAITCCCLWLNHAATCKQRTDDGASSSGAYGGSATGRTLLLGEPALCSPLRHEKA